MRKFWISAAALALAATAVADGKKDKGPKVPDGYAWEQNYEAAKLKAAEAGKLFFIDFYTES
ncbi:MAG: hypothetical protein HYY18_07770 [Planctomycetes bacterium]|nr:hypothetical protein [Planctomycetota bacterium]